MFNAASTALDHMRSKRVRGIAISSAKRSPLAPDLPTVAESGVPGYEAVIWQGVLARPQRRKGWWTACTAK